MTKVNINNQSLMRLPGGVGFGALAQVGYCFLKRNKRNLVIIFAPESGVPMESIAVLVRDIDCAKMLHSTMVIKTIMVDLDLLRNLYCNLR